MNFWKRFWLCLKHNTEPKNRCAIVEEVTIDRSVTCRKNGPADLMFHDIPVYIGQDICIARHYNVNDLPCVANVPLMAYHITKTSCGIYYSEIYTTSEFGRLSTMKQRALLHYQKSIIEQHIAADQQGNKFEDSLNQRLIADRYASHYAGVSEYASVLTNVVEDMEAIDAVLCKDDKTYPSKLIAEYEARIAAIKTIKHTC